MDFNWSLSDHWILGPKCDNSTITDQCLEKGVPSIGFVSDTFSIISSVLIIVSFIAFKDMRTQARTFLFYISVADLFNSLWFMFAHIWSLVNIRYSTCYAGKPLFEVSMCIIQAVMNVYFTMTSFYWTIILAIYILSLLYNRKWFVTRKSRIILGAIGWFVPIPLTIIGTLANRFGPGRGTASAGWCFISYYTIDQNLTVIHAVSEILGGKIFDVATLTILTVIYTVAVVKYFRKRMKLELCLVTEQEVKLALIPIAYIFIRIWGNIRWILELYQAIRNYDRICYTFLIYLQAVGDPAQGWVNGILFLILTKELRERIFGAFFSVKNCCFKRENRFDIETNKYVSYNSIPKEEMVSKDFNQSVKRDYKVSPCL